MPSYGKIMKAGLIVSIFVACLIIRTIFFMFKVNIMWLIFLELCLVVNAHVKRPQDEDIQSNVLEIIGSNIQSTYITCPADPAATLGIKLPFLVLIVKNLKKYFTFEIQVLDDKNVRRRFRASNFQVCKSAHVCVSNGFTHNLQNFNFFHMYFVHDCLLVPNIIENFDFLNSNALAWFYFWIIVFFS